MFKIYIASHYERIEEMRSNEQFLEDRGYHVTSRWLHGHNDPEKWKTGVYGEIDLIDIDSSHFLVAFVDNEPHIRCGLQTEIGYAMALDLRRVFIVGPRVNVFHQMLDDDRVFPTMEEFVHHLDYIHAEWRHAGKLFPVLRPSQRLSVLDMYEKIYLPSPERIALEKRAWEVQQS